MGMAFQFKSKEQALTFAAAVEDRFGLMTNTADFSHIDDVYTFQPLRNLDHPDHPENERHVEVDRAGPLGSRAAADAAFKIEDQIRALAKEEFDGEFVGT
jgi:hypothetical protein